MQLLFDCLTFFFLVYMAFYLYKRRTFVCLNETQIIL